MDRAYEGNETRQLALELGFDPVVPPLSNRVSPWEYDKELYKRRNEVERLFRRLKGFRRIFSRFDKLDVLFLGFILVALIFDGLRSVNTPSLITRVRGSKGQYSYRITTPRTVDLGNVSRVPTLVLAEAEVIGRRVGSSRQNSRPR